MDVALQRLLLGRDGRSQMLTGLRGVGKTVLLVEFGTLAESREYFHEHIEVSEDGVLAPELVGAFRRVLLAMDAKRRIGERVRRALGILKAFSLKLPDGLEISIDVDAVAGPADSGNLSSDLAALFVEVGEVARAYDTGVLITIDELHYVDYATLTALITGLHRASQLNLPITVAGAGLPSLAALTGDVKTYAERLFEFSTIGSLSDELASSALTIPAIDEGVTWEEGALARTREASRGFPYFIQEFGKAAWNLADGPDRITLDDVERSMPLAIAQLDDGFFRVRIGKTNDSERAYLRAMAELGRGPVNSADVAKILGKTTNALGPTRDALIRWAMCFSPRRGLIEFTVPLFDEYMIRLMPQI